MHSRPRFACLALSPPQSDPLPLLRPASRTSQRTLRFLSVVRRRHPCPISDAPVSQCRVRTQGVTVRFPLPIRPLISLSDRPLPLSASQSSLLICRPHACVRTLWRRYYRSCRAQPPIAPNCPRLSGFMRSAFTDSRVSKPCPSRRGDSRSRPLSRSFRHLHLFVSLSALVALVGGKLVIFRQLAQSPPYRSPLHNHATSQTASPTSSA